MLADPARTVEPTSGAEADAGPSSPASVWPYIAPMVVFLVMTQAEAWLPQRDGRPDPRWYPLAYVLKAVLVTVAAVLCRSAWRDLRPWPRPGGWAAAIGLGLVVTVVWIGLERTGYHDWLPAWIPLPKPEGARAAFDPGVLSPSFRVLFLIARFYGLVLLVPLIEELFWRSFLLRWVIDPQFWRVPIGRVTAGSAALSSLLFAAVHPEWLPALLTGLAWAGLLARTGSLSACVISHAVANLALGVYVVTTGDWRFW